MDRPKLTKSELLDKIKDFDLKGHELYIVGIRGYYLNSMGSEGVNDIAIYDDAIFGVSPDYFGAFNANTDPSKHQQSIATLKPGIYFAHKFDVHHGSKGSYPAICQRLGDVTVYREGYGMQEFTGQFGINIHKGGFHTTSSLGCQTVYPEQYNEFYTEMQEEAVQYYGERWNKEVIPYILIENK